jgi:hypothetical protein
VRDSGSARQPACVSRASGCAQARAHARARAPAHRATTGLFPHAARRQPDGRYRVIASGQVVSLHPASCLRPRAPECVVFSELVVTSK